MICRRPVRRRAAFTLIELVISTALMALILTAAYACLSAGLAGRKLVEPRTEILQSARVVLQRSSRLPQVGPGFREIGLEPNGFLQSSARLLHFTQVGVDFGP